MVAHKLALRSSSFLFLVCGWIMESSYNSLYTQTNSDRTNIGLFVSISPVAILHQVSVTLNSLKLQIMCYTCMLKTSGHHFKIILNPLATRAAKIISILLTSKLNPFFIHTYTHKPLLRSYELTLNTIDFLYPASYFYNLFLVCVNVCLTHVFQ